MPTDDGSWKPGFDFHKGFLTFAFLLASSPVTQCEQVCTGKVRNAIKNISYSVNLTK